MAFDLDPNYVDVASRIVEFRNQYPNGALQQHALEFRSFAGTDWVIYTAAAYRGPDDNLPGHGTAWEPVPGKTNFTRGSELQNAETAAWGRAIVAVLAADTKRGIASADEVRNATAAREPAPPRYPDQRSDESDDEYQGRKRKRMFALFGDVGLTSRDAQVTFIEETLKRSLASRSTMVTDEYLAVIRDLEAEQAEQLRVDRTTGEVVQ